MFFVTFVLLILSCHGNFCNEVIGDEEIMEKIQSMFPYCRIGEDEYGAGVYFAPFAAWKFGELATDTPLEIQTFELFLEQMIRGYMDDGGRDGEGITLILDCAGLDLGDLLAPNALEISMKMYAKSREYARAARKFIIINMALSPQLFGDIWNPLLGDLLPRTEMYGSNPEEWLPHLADSMPNDVLLQGYGGTNPMPPKCNREETKRPFRFPTVENFNSAIVFIAQNPSKLMGAVGNGFSIAIGNFQSALGSFFG